MSLIENNFALSKDINEYVIHSIIPLPANKDLTEKRRLFSLVIAGFGITSLLNNFASGMFS